MPYTTALIILAGLFTILVYRFEKNRFHLDRIALVGVIITLIILWIEVSKEQEMSRYKDAIIFALEAEVLKEPPVIAKIPVE